MTHRSKSPEKSNDRLRHAIESGQERGGFSEEEVVAMMAHFAITRSEETEDYVDDSVLMGVGDRIVVRKSELALGRMTLRKEMTDPVGIFERAVGQHASGKLPVSFQVLLRDERVRYLAADKPRVPRGVILKRLLANDVSWFTAPTRAITVKPTVIVSHEQVAQSLELALAKPEALDAIVYDIVVLYMELGNVGDAAAKLGIPSNEANLILREFASKHNIILPAYKRPKDTIPTRPTEQ